MSYGPFPHKKDCGQSPLQENFSWDPKWSNFICWNWHPMSISTNEIAIFRFILKTFPKRKLTMSRLSYTDKLQISLQRDFVKYKIRKAAKLQTVYFRHEFSFLISEPSYDKWKSLFTACKKHSILFCQITKMMIKF